MRSPYIQRRVVNLHFGQTFTESDSVCQFLYGLMRSFNPFERFNLLRRKTVNWIQLQSQYNNISCFLSTLRCSVDYELISKLTLYDTSKIESIFS